MSSPPYLPLAHPLRDPRYAQHDHLIRPLHVASIFNTNVEIGGKGEANMNGPEAHFRRYSAAVELAKYCEREMSEVEFDSRMR